MNKKELLFVIIAFLASSATVMAQSYAFGIKGGLLAGLQQWEGRNRTVLLKPHGLLFIESADEDESYSVYAEAGFHQRGSAQRNVRFIDQSGNFFDAPTQEYIFNNVSLSLGAKDKRILSSDIDFYYGLGVRVEYTISNNLDVFQEQFEDIYGTVLIGYPIPEYVRKWNYGITVMGGIEYHLSGFVAGVLELRVSPDFSAQYHQPPIAQAYDPVSGTTRSYSEQKAYNVSIELTAGFRFLHKITYID